MSKSGTCLCPDQGCTDKATNPWHYSKSMTKTFIAFEKHFEAAEIFTSDFIFLRRYTHYTYATPIQNPYMYTCLYTRALLATLY